MPEAKVSQFDFGRVIRTEVLPYEIPYRFSYDCLDERGHPVRRHVKSLIDTGDGKKRTRPIQFNISKSPLSSSSRLLTLMPPICAMLWCEFYKKYSQIILSLCNRSRWSLRRPSGIAKVFSYTAADWSKNAPTDFDQEGLEGEMTSSKSKVQSEFQDQNSISSFFVYSTCTTLHQFYNSNDLRRLEKKYRMCGYADISNCFNSIYSHSISWAILGKSEAKDCIEGGDGFSSEFDRLMRNSNYGETAGIPIGPEISRIFSEIILQRCDIEVEKSLSRKGFLDRRDYTIRRYIDDYFVFCNTEHHREIIITTISDEIAKYNLHLSESKSSTMYRPFVSMISLSKKRISESAGLFFSALEENAIYSQSNSQRRAIKFVDELRYIASEHSETFKPLVPFTLGILKKHSKKALRLATDPKFMDSGFNRIIEILCIAEELLAMCLNFRVTIVISEILFNVSTEIRKIQSPHGETIASFCASVSHEFLSCLSTNPPACRADFFTLLLVCRDLGSQQRIRFSEFLAICRLEDGLEELTGFELCVSIYYYSGSNLHNTELEKIIQASLDKVCASIAINSDSDLFCLAFDLLSCPLLSKSRKRPIIDKVDPAGNWADDHWGRVFERDSFFSWRDEKSPSTFLQKKSLSSGY